MKIVLIQRFISLEISPPMENVLANFAFSPFLQGNGHKKSLKFILFLPQFLLIS